MIRSGTAKLPVAIFFLTLLAVWLARSTGSAEQAAQRTGATTLKDGRVEQRNFDASPAIVNALATLTGERYRTLPLVTL